MGLRKKVVKLIVVMTIRELKERATTFMNESNLKSKSKMKKKRPKNNVEK